MRTPLYIGPYKIWTHRRTLKDLMTEWELEALAELALKYQINDDIEASMKARKKEIGR
jgi:hypothetical protein